MNRTKHSIQNSFWGLTYRLLHMVLPVILRAIIIRKIGAAYVGVNGLFKSILSVLNLTELGFGTAVVYMMYKPIAENDTKTIRTLLSLLRKMYRWIGITMLMLGMAVVPFLNILVKNDTGTEVNITLLYSFHLFHTVMSYWLFSYKSTLFTAHQETYNNYKIMVMCGIVQYSLQILALYFTRNYYVYMAIYAFMIIPQNLLYHFYSKKKYPDLYCEGQPTDQQVKVIKSKISSLLGHRIGNTVIFSIDSIIISAFIGVKILTKYDNYNYILTSVVTLVGVISSSIMASVGNKLVLESDTSNYNLFKKLNYLWIGLIGWCTTCLMSLYQPFIMVWVGEKYLFDNSIVICISLYFFVWQFRYIGIVVKDAAGLWEDDKWKPYIGMFLNVILSIFFVKITESILGVLIPTMMILLLIYYPWETHILFSRLFKRSSREFLLLNTRYVISAFTGAGITYILCRLPAITGLTGLIVRAIICIVVMPLVYVGLTFSSEQFQEIKKIITGLSQKKYTNNIYNKGSHL